jgi:hypothetical protein
MDSVTYHLIYDVRQALPNAWWLPLFTLLVAFGGFAFYRSTRSSDSTGASIFALGVLVIGSLGTLVAVTGTIIPYFDMRRDVSRGQYRVVEGIVREFVPGDAGDHRSESWTVMTATGPVCFSYSPSLLDAGYNQTAPHGGRIAGGVRVRVFDVDGRIARLEIGQ